MDRYAIFVENAQNGHVVRNLVGTTNSFGDAVVAKQSINRQEYGHPLIMDQVTARVTYDNTSWFRLNSGTLQ